MGRFLHIAHKLAIKAGINVLLRNDTINCMGWNLLIKWNKISVVPHVIDCYWLDGDSSYEWLWSWRIWAESQLGLNVGTPIYLVWRQALIICLCCAHELQCSTVLEEISQRAVWQTRFTQAQSPEGIYIQTTHVLRSSPLCVPFTVHYRVMRLYTMASEKNRKCSSLCSVVLLLCVCLLWHVREIVSNQLLICWERSRGRGVPITVLLFHGRKWDKKWEQYCMEWFICLCHNWRTLGTWPWIHMESTKRLSQKPVEWCQHDVWVVFVAESLEEYVRSESPTDLSPAGATVRISSVTSWCILKVLRMTVTLGNPQTCWIKWSETDDFAFFSMRTNCLYIEMSMSCIDQEHSSTVWIEIFQKLIVWPAHLMMQGGLVSTWHACGAYVYICTVHV